jgi:hypothetical protein
MTARRSGEKQKINREGAKNAKKMLKCIDFSRPSLMSSRIFFAWQDFPRPSMAILSVPIRGQEFFNHGWARITRITPRQYLDLADFCAKIFVTFGACKNEFCSSVFATFAASRLPFLVAAKGWAARLGGIQDECIRAVFIRLALPRPLPGLFPNK